MLKKDLKSLSLAAMLGLIAGGYGEPTKKQEPKPSTKMPLTEDELKHLSSLSGKNKKIYVKKLREKYRK